jgi:GxxExxY protein
MQDSRGFVQDLLFKDECYQIIGICMKIHSILGKGFKEVVYKDAIEVEFKKANMFTNERNNLIFNMRTSFFLTNLTLISSLSTKSF